MQTEYHVSVWRKAMHDADDEVMRATATPDGGRRQGEDLLSYVARAKKIQDAAVARWLTARDELLKAGGGSYS